MANLMQELFAEAGYEARPSGGYGGGLGTPPTQGTITYIFGSTITIQDLEDAEKTTDVEVGEDTNITIINSLDVSDLPIGTNVNGVVRRGEGGNIFVVSLDVAPQNPGGGFGFGGFGGAGGDNTVSAIQGTIAEVNDDMMIHVETTQGTLRLTANDKSVIVSTTTGTLTDLSEGMGVVVIGPSKTVPSKPAPSSQVPKNSSPNKTAASAVQGGGRRGSSDLISLSDNPIRHLSRE